MVIGSICDCGIISHATSSPQRYRTDDVLGIPKLEEAAKAVREIAKDNRQKMWKSPLDHIFSEDEKIELSVRKLVRGYKDERTGKPIVEDIELEKVLFDVVYPLFGSRQTAQVDQGDKEDEGWSCSVQ